MLRPTICVYDNRHQCGRLRAFHVVGNAVAVVLTMAVSGAHFLILARADGTRHGALDHMSTSKGIDHVNVTNKDDYSASNVYFI